MALTTETNESLKLGSRTRENTNFPEDAETTRSQIHEGAMTKALALEIAEVAANVVKLILDKGTRSGTQTEVLVIDLTATQLLQQILVEQRITNLHMALITDKQFHSHDVEEK